MGLFFMFQVILLLQYTRENWLRLMQVPYDLEDDGTRWFSLINYIYNNSLTNIMLRVILVENVYSSINTTHFVPVSVITSSPSMGSCTFSIHPSSFSEAIAFVQEIHGYRVSLNLTHIQTQFVIQYTCIYKVVARFRILSPHEILF